MKYLASWALAALLPAGLTACAPDGGAPADTAQAAPEQTMVETPLGQTVRTPALFASPPYRDVHDTLWLMQNIVQPAAEVFWGSAGWVIDAAGEHNLRPTTEERWAEVVTHAAIVAQMGNLLMTPPFADGRGDDWLQFSGSLVEIGMRAQQAAELRDEEMIFDVGATLNRVCDGCHTMYVDPDAVYEAISAPVRVGPGDDGQGN